ncbi:MAG: Y-family DNA polymerase [Patescibacteria group bacterium]
MFALIDCNNFFVSCQRVFRPDLQNKPVAVLSNNDGCIISRSNEVKQLGIPMAAPVFKYKNQIRESQTTIFSANFDMYGDFSQRVMSILAYFGDIEIYSIDEAFLNLRHIHSNQLEEFGREIKNTVFQYTAIPVSIGMTQTKTLAKIANETAKKDSRSHNALGGVFVLDNNANDLDSYLEKINTEDVWGIGYKGAKKLSKQKIFTAKDFKYANSSWVKANLSLLGLKTQKELNGTDCLDLQSVAESKKGIASTRSFGKYVSQLEELKEAIAYHVSLASKKLRKQKSLANYIHVFIMTNRFHKISYQLNSKGITLPTATDYTPDLIKLAYEALVSIYQPNTLYKKAGVYLAGLIPIGQTQIDIFSEDTNSLQKKKAVRAMDEIQKQFGDKALQIAARGTSLSWLSKSSYKSPDYTTKWSDLPIIQI